MNGAGHCFFFSYSRADWNDDPYLQRFFRDLDRRVARAKGLAERRAGFRDEIGVKTGDDWNSTISAALQESDVLVCIYTPNFFSEDKPFCSKEFMGFLKRNRPIRYVRTRNNGEYQYQVRDARNILPILWSSEAELVGVAKLPPFMVQKIQYALAAEGLSNDRLAEYKRRGLCLIAAERAFAYEEILDHLALRIATLSTTPLPPIAPPPDIETLADAFRDLPDADIVVDEAAPEPVAAVPAAPLSGPKTMLALEVSFHTPAPVWIPYAGESSLRGLVEEIAQSRRPRLAYRHRRFDPDTPDFLAGVWDILGTATADQVVPILFVHPACLGQAGARSALAELMRRDWRGGLIVPVDAADSASVQLAEEFHSESEQARIEKEPTPIRIPTTVAEFRTATDSVAADVLLRIMTLGTVRQTPPQNDGPPLLPRVTNAHDAPRQL